MEITAPTIEYGLLMPFILIFAGACLGVLVEGFVPRASRRVAQLTIVYAAIAAALFMTLRNWTRAPPDGGRRGFGQRRRADLVHVGHPADLRRHLLPADRRPDRGERGQRVRPAGRGRARHGGGGGGGPRRGRAHRGLPAGAVRPVRDDAVPGLDRPDHHVHRAGDLVAAALRAVRAGPPPAAAVAGVVAEVLPARRDVVGDLPLRRGPALRVRRVVRLRRPSTPRCGPAPGTRCCCWPGWPWSGSGCCSSSAPCRSTPGPPTCTPVPRPR